MKTEIIRNTTAQMPDRTVQPGEVIENVQICPFGDFPNGGKMQHCTAEALRNVAEQWRADGAKEILVDFEHNSEQGGTSDTSAAAWVSNVRVDPARGLVGDFKLTDVGAEAISNRRLRFLSVAWFVNRETREPMRLTSIALTNKPNIPVAPILNKEKFEGEGEQGKDTSVGLGPSSSPKNQEKFEGEGEQGKDASIGLGPSSSPKNQERNPNMDKIKEALGLAPEATEEDVLNAIAAMVKKNKDAEQAALEKEAEDFAEQNSKKCNKQVLKAQYLANREVAKAIVAGIPDAPAPQQLLNRAPSAHPGAKDDLVKELNKLPAGEARIKFIHEHAAEFAVAAK